MPIAKFELPDGRVARFEVPEGTTPEQAQQMIAPMIGGLTSEEPTKETPGVFSQIVGLPGEVAKGFIRGITTDPASGIASLGYTGARAAGYEGPRFEETGLGKALGKAQTALAPSDEGLITQFGSGLGSLASFIPGGLLKGGIGLATKLTQAGAVGSEEARARAEQARLEGKADATAGQQLLAQLGGTGVGFTELAPVERLAGPIRDVLRGVPKSAADQIAPGLFNTAKRMLVTGGIEGLQEGMANVAQDLIQKGVYDPNLSIGESALGDAAMGASVGAFAQGAIDFVTRGKRTAMYNQLREQENAKRQKEEEEKASAEREQQRQQTLKNFNIQDRVDEKTGLPILALPAPTGQIDPQKTSDPYFDPLNARFTADDIGPEAVKKVNEARKERGLPKLNEFTVEDLLETGDSQQTVSLLLGRKLGYDGSQGEISPQGIVELAKSKNIETTDEGFRDFMKRTAGATALGRMSQPQLFAVQQALEQIPTFEQTTSLPVGTNAKLFDESTYAKTINSIKSSGVLKDGTPVGKSQVIQEIKDFSGLVEDRDAERLLQTAFNRGDLESEVTQGTTSTSINVKLASPTSPLIGGPDVRRGDYREEKPVGYEVRSTDGSFSTVVQSLTEAERIREAQRNLRAKRVGKLSENLDGVTAQIEAAEDKLQELTDAGEAGSETFKRIEKNVANLKSKADKLKSSIVSNGQDLDITQKKKPVSRQGYTLFENNVPVGTFATEEEAQRAAVRNLTDEQLEGIINNAPVSDVTGAVETPSGPEALTRTPAKKTAMVRRVYDEAVAEKERRYRSAMGLPPPAAPVQIKITGDALAAAERLRAAGLTVRFAPEVVKEVPEINKRLQAVLDKLGLKDVRLKLVESMKVPGFAIFDSTGEMRGFFVRPAEGSKDFQELKAKIATLKQSGYVVKEDVASANGSYAAKLIQIALDSDNPIRAVRHEALHAMKELGFFTPSQWAILERKAKSEWMKKYGIAGRYSNLNEEGQIEEAIADAFSDFDQTQPPPGMIGALFRKIKLFFEALGNAFRGSGFQTANDVFTRVEEGRLGEPEVQARGDIAKERYSLRAPETKEFKQWFGDSKVVDENGDPLVVYHGTQADIDAFTTDAEKANRGGNPDGFYFTPDQEEASKYAEKPWKNEFQAGANVMPVYLALKNPFNYSGNQNYRLTPVTEKMVKQFEKELREENPYLGPEWYQEKLNTFRSRASRGTDPFPGGAISSAAMTRVLKAGGFDGMIDGRHFVVFEPSQIKSAISNVGAFDVTTPDIRYSLREPKITGTGKIIGAPPGLSSEADRAKLVDDMVELLEHPFAMYNESKDWYERSGAAIREITRGNPELMERVVRLMSLYSQANQLGGNTTATIKSIAQLATGQDTAYAGRFPNETAKRIPAILAAKTMDDSLPGVDDKLMNFYRNLHDATYQTNTFADASTVDRWMMRLFGYPHAEDQEVGGATGVSKPQYVYAKDLIQRIADAEFARTGEKLLPRQVQAVLWTYVKNKTDYDSLPADKKASFVPSTIDFNDYVVRATANITWESRPSTSLDMIPGVHTAPRQQQEAFNKAVREIFVDPRTGEDKIFKLLGNQQLYSSQYSTGAYENQVVPNVITKLVLQKDDGDYLTDVANNYAAIVGYVTKQDAVPWYRADATATGKDASVGFRVTPSAVASPEFEERLFNYLNKKMPGIGFTRVGDSFDFINFRGEDGKPFFAPDKQYKEKLLESLRTFAPDVQFDVEPFRAKSGWIANNWKENPDGQSYLERLRTAGLGDLQDTIDGWSKDYDQIAEGFGREYGWAKYSLRSDEPTSGSRLGDGISIRDRQPTAQSFDAVHYGKQSVSTLLGSMYGTGIRGAEAQRVFSAPDERLRRRAYFYIPLENGTMPLPEAGLGNYVHVQRLNNLLGPGPEAQALVRAAKASGQFDENAFESSVIDAGYDGYAVPQMGMAVVLDADVPVVQRGTRQEVFERPADRSVTIGGQKYSLRQTDTPQFKNWFGKSTITDERGQPKVMYHGTARDISEFRPKQANAIFVTDNPEFAGQFTEFSESYMMKELSQQLEGNPAKKREILERAVEAAIAKDNLATAQNTNGRFPYDKDYWVDQFMQKPLDLARRAYGLRDDLEPAMLAMLPSRANIMPLFIRAENPFDYQNESHLKKITQKIFATDPDFFDPLSAKGRLRRKELRQNLIKGEWETIESDTVQDAINELGFDSFYAQEMGNKNLALYNPNQLKSAIGNIGTFSRDNNDISYSLALDGLQSQSRLIPNEGGNPDGNLGIAPSILESKPIRLLIGTHDDIEDKGFGAKHILSRIQSDPRRAPQMGTEELLERIVKEAQRTAQSYTRIYQDQGKFILFGGRNTLVVSPEKDSMSIVTMYKQETPDRRYGNPIWQGRAPSVAEFLAPVRGMEVEAEGKDIIPKPAAVARKRNVYTPRSIADLAAEVQTTKPGKITLKKAPEKYSLAVPKEARDDFFAGTEYIPESQSVEQIRSDWIYRFGKEIYDPNGNETGQTGRDQAYLLPDVVGGQEYIDAVQQYARETLGESFKGYRLMSLDEFEELKTGAMGSQLVSFALDPEFALKFANVARKQKFGKGERVVVEFPITPEHVQMIGSPNETEVVIDYGVGYNPDEVNGYASPVKFSLRQEIIDGADAIARMPEEVRDDTEYSDMPGGYRAYNLYEARKLAPKPTNKLKKVTENNSYTLHTEADYVLNVDGEHYYVNLQEDPDDEDAFVYSFTPATDPLAYNETTTFDVDELIKEIRAREPKAPEAKKYSLADLPIDPEIRKRIEATTFKRTEKNLGERMTAAFEDRERTYIKLRQAFLNKYEAIERLTKKIADRLGNVELMADTSAIAAALMSDRAAGFTAATFGSQNRKGGIPVYKNGGYTIDQSVNGLVEALAPLAKLGQDIGVGPEIYRMFQYYAGSVRGKRLLAEVDPKTGKIGLREKLFDKKDVEYGKQLGEKYPVFKEVFNNYQKYNEGLVKFMKDTGVISAREATLWTENWDYIPFYRQLNGEEGGITGPKVFSSISGVSKPHKLEGSKEELTDFLESVTRNARAAIEAGMKNVASQRVVRDVLRANLGEMVPKGTTGNDIVTFKDQGQTKYVRVADPLLVEALKGLDMPQIPFLSILSKPADVLRNLVTKDPGFMIANLARDSLQSWITSGVPMKPLVDTYKQAVMGIAGGTPEMQALFKSGFFGGYDYTGSVELGATQLAKEIRKASKTQGPGEKINAMTLGGIWEALDRGSQVSDLATRAEVYKRVLEQTGNETEAMFQAMEVLNFSRKGNSTAIRFLTAIIPFFNARIQGLDVLYRAGFGKMAMSSRETQQKAFIYRALTLLGLSAMYWAVVHDDDDYLEMSQEERDNNWLVNGVKIPIPFELGVVFKVLPERIANYYAGLDTGSDVWNSFKRNIGSTLNTNFFIPQAVLPLVEVSMNSSMFTGNPIVGMQYEGVRPSEQIAPGTSKTAIGVAESINAALSAVGAPSSSKVSPIQVDYLIRGYTGTLGQYASQLLDTVMQKEGDPVKASLRLEQMPVFKRFLAAPAGEGRGPVDDYYSFKKEVDMAARTANFLTERMDYEGLVEFYKGDGAKLIAMKPYINSLDKEMKGLREFRNVVLMSRDMSPDDKSETLRAIRRAENAITGRIRYLRKELSRQ